MFDIWRNSERLAEKIYASGNYEIVDNEKNTQRKNENPRCVIYCSSNNIWYPNEEEAFRRSFIENNYYEWRRLRVRDVDREIWIRDIYKSWYVTGINSEIDSVDKLIVFLQDLTKGYSVEIIGSSAGGYIAALLSKALNAVKTIVFSAQFDLNYPDLLNYNPYLQKYKETERGKYYDLSEYLKDSTSDLFYVYPICNIHDIHHYERIAALESKYIHCMGLKSKRHGMVMYKCCIEKLINLNSTDLKELFLSEDHKYPLSMSLKFVGGGQTLQNVFNEACLLIKKIIKKTRLILGK